MQYTADVRTTVKAPCHGALPLILLADFLASSRYFKVGIVVAIMAMIGTNPIVEIFIGFIFFQSLDL